MPPHLRKGSTLKHIIPCRDDMLEDISRGSSTAYQNQGGRPQADMSKLSLDQRPPRVLGAPPQAYPPGPVSCRPNAKRNTHLRQSQSPLEWAAQAVL